ncbi:MAG: cadherin domain-containing protein, partial [Desulfuromonadaceae bacterium]
MLRGIIMAKKIAAGDVKFSTNVSGVEKAKDAIPLTPDMKGGNTFSASMSSKGHRGKGLEDEILEDKDISSAATEQAAPDSSGAASDQPVLLAQADVPLVPGNDPVTTEQKGVSSSGSNSVNWWLGGIGLAAVGTGLGIALSGSDSGNDTTNASPVIGSNGGGASANISVAENQAAVTTVTATDVDAGDGKTFSISGGADATKFQINASTGVLTFVAAPDFETVADSGANNVYNVQVTVTDTAGLTDVQDIAVTVTGVNDNNPVFTSATAASVAENSTAVLTVAATDADLPAQTVTYSITGGADASKFTINSTTGVLSFVSAPDFDTPTDAGANNVYDVQVTANDGNGGTTAQNIAVTVTGVNETPTITSGGTGIVAENAATSTVIYDANAIDPDAGTSITYSLKAATGDVAMLIIDSSTGEVRLNNSADYETKASYSFTVITSDGSTSTEHPVTVAVTDVDEFDVTAPTDSNGATNTVAENAANGTAVGITASASDADATTNT